MVKIFYKKNMKKLCIVLSMILVVGIISSIKVLADVSASSKVIKINNTSLSFDKIIYVDGTKGNDTSGDGTETNPYATIPKAYGTITQDNVCIYIVGAGTYNAQTLNSLINPNYSISYIVKDGLEGQVVLNLNGISSSNARMTKTNSFYGFVIKKTGGDSRMYEYFFDPATINLEFNNCVFDLINGAPTGYPIFTGNSAGCTVTKLAYNNCSFMSDFSIKNSGIAYLKGTFSNSAFKKTAFTSQTSNLTGVTFDSAFNITSSGWQNVGTGTNPDNTQSNVGVYGGPFAWNFNEVIKATGLTLDRSSASILVGQTDNLVATITPDDATQKDVEWKSSDESIVTVDNTGKITGIAEGSATIIISSKDDASLTANCNVTVTKPITKVTGLTLNKSSASILVGQIDNLVVTVIPDNATQKDVEWKSSDESIVTVDNTGKITGIAEGSATIIVSSKDDTNLTASCNVTVTKPIDTSKQRAILSISMINDQIKEYDLSKNEIDSFVNWFESSNGKGQTKFAFNKKITPYTDVKEYVVFDKISSYEIRTYTGQ